MSTAAGPLLPHLLLEAAPSMGRASLCPWGTFRRS